ncbi:hypothetical protein EON65_16410 [archaeon]|nr:MAG: hypothetical protein EON65_16410 [archaeon]
MEKKLDKLPGVVTSFDQALNTIFMNTRFDNLDVKYPEDDIDGENLSDEVSYEKFHKLFHDSLHNSRVLNSVQAYLRKQVITKLSSNPTMKSKALPTGEISIVDRMLFSSLHDLLKHRGYHVTLSLLMAETGMEKSNNLIKETDMVKFIHLPALRRHYLARLADKSAPSTCMLDVVYPYLFQPEAHNATMKEMSCQTDGHGPSYRDLLDKDIRTIYNTYKQETENQQVASKRGLDDFLYKYKQDLEKEYEEKLDAQFAIWKELEITKARAEVRKECEQEYKQYKDTYMKEIEKHKLLLQEKEWTLERQYHDKTQSWEKTYYEERQKMLKQLEDNKHTIEMMQYKVTVEKQHLSSQDLHYKELEYKYQARENKIMEMEKQLAHDKLSCMEIAKKECRQAYALELEELGQKKLDLLSKQMQVDREKDYIDSYKEKITFYQQEVGKLKKDMAEALVEMDRYKAQEEDVYKTLSTVYQSTLNHDVLDILTCVLQKYKELEAENTLLSDHKGLLAMMHEKDGVRAMLI